MNPKTNRCNKIKTSKKQTNKHDVVKTQILNKVTNKKNNSVINQSLYNVKEKGVMLAHTYKDPHTGKIKNPPKGFPKAPEGWYASEKFDGYRAIWDGIEFRSRNGKVFSTPVWFKKWMPKDIALDGELFLGRECFEKCGLFRKKIPSDNEWRDAGVIYQIFDTPSVNKPFEERQKIVENVVKKMCAMDSTEDMGKCPLKLTKQTKVNSEEEVYKMFDSLVEKGAEGVMLRCPGSYYESKRTSTLLKVKPFFDDECRIIGYKEGTGKYLGKLGAFHCETIKKPNVKFYISGMNDEIRNNYKETHPLGTIVTYTYVGVTESGVPRHPNYLRKRPTE